MKEKFSKAMGWIKAHKKRSCGIAVAFLLIIGVVGIGIAGVYVSKGDGKAATVTEKNTEKKTVKESSDSKKDTDKKKEEAAFDQEKKEDDEKTKSADNAEGQQITADSSSASSQAQSQQAQDTSNVGAGSSGNAGSSGGGSNQTYVPPASETQEHVHQWQQKYKDEPVWVDTSGYVSEPIMRCGICNEDITDNPGAHLEAHALAGEGVGNAYSDTKQVWKESGYWDTQSVPDGYQCSCGDTK